MRLVPCLAGQSLVFVRTNLSIVVEYEFGEAFDICIEVTDSDSRSRDTVHLSQLMSRVCPTEAGWASARSLPKSWPRSLDLTSVGNLHSLCPNYARVLKDYCPGLLDGSTQLRELMIGRDS